MHNQPQGSAELEYIPSCHSPVKAIPEYCSGINLIPTNPVNQFSVINPISCSSWRHHV